jgi:hypothetical protein
MPTYLSGAQERPSRPGVRRPVSSKMDPGICIGIQL